MLCNTNVTDVEEQTEEIKKRINKLEDMILFYREYDNILKEIESLKYENVYDDYSFQNAYNTAIDDVIELIEELDKYTL